jgi:4-amino-4-deoxy-L-arabinose transferase-like glycosyltransferase
VWCEWKQQLLLCWLGAFFVFLSIAVTKRQMYLLPAYPAVALLIGQWVAVTIRGPTTQNERDRRLGNLFVGAIAVLLLVTGGSFVLAGLAVGFVIPRFGLEPLYQSLALDLRTPGFVIGLLALGGGFWVMTAWRQSDLTTGFHRTAATLLSLYLLAFAWFMPGFDPVKTYKPAARWVLERIGNETHFGLAFPRRGFAKMGAFGFYSGRLVELLNSEEAIEEFLRKHPNSVVLLAKRAVKKIYGKDRTDWQDRVVKELVAGRYEYFVLSKRR